MDTTPKSLEQRLQAVEDHLELLQIVASYGIAVDAGDLQLLKDLWAEDGVYESQGIGRYSGHEALESLFGTKLLQDGLSDGCAHAASPPYIVIDGDRATATSHGLYFKHENGTNALLRLVASRWAFERRNGRWHLTGKTNALLNGNSAARGLFAQYRNGPDA